MSVEPGIALNLIRDAANEIFDADASVRSVGVGLVADGYGFIAVRNSRAISPFRGIIGARAAPTNIAGISVEYVNSSRDPSNLARLPHSGPGSPGIASIIDEQLSHAGLVCGLQIQNFDDDVRTGMLAKGLMTVGSIGCFVIPHGGGIAMLSNNHVIAGENRGGTGTDRIMQAGGATPATTSRVATLGNFVPLRPSPQGATLAAGNVILNEVDAALAMLGPAVVHSQSYLPANLPFASPARGTASASIGDKVHKVGRTTGLTWGTVRQIGVTVGPIAYDPGPCWFQLSMVIESDDGTTFSDHGDSGSAIVRNDGMLLGILYAGNGKQTYACPVAEIFTACQCQLA